VGEICTCIAEARGPFFESPENFSGPKSLLILYVVKGTKVKITAKFRASRRLGFEDTKRIMSLEMRPKSFGTFEKRAPGLKFSDIRTFISAMISSNLFVSRYLMEVMRSRKFCF